MAIRKIYYLEQKAAYEQATKCGHAVLSCLDNVSTWKLEVILYGKDHASPCYVIQYRKSLNWQGKTITNVQDNSVQKWIFFIYPESPLYLELQYKDTCYLICDERSLSDSSNPPFNENSHLQKKESSPLPKPEVAALSSPTDPVIEPVVFNNDNILSQSRISLWEKLISRYGLIHPFSVEYEAIAFSPNEIHRVTSADRILEENSFLLHGYYQFRHILFFRSNCSRQSSFTKLLHTDPSNNPIDNLYIYYLGVPGIWQKQEKIVAEMFGFSQFMEKKTENTSKLFPSAPSYGTFGYYYREIQAINELL